MDDLFDEAVGIAVFVVIPGHDFYHVAIDDAGKAQIDDGGFRTADDVGADERFIGNGENVYIERVLGGGDKHLVDFVD